MNDSQSRSRARIIQEKLCDFLTYDMSRGDSLGTYNRSGQVSDMPGDMTTRIMYLEAFHRVMEQGVISKEEYDLARTYYGGDDTVSTFFTVDAILYRACIEMVPIIYDNG